MNPGKNCPHCGRDIGVWPIFSAALPNRIWCPHCKSRLRYRNTTGSLATVLAIGLLVAVGAYGAAERLAPSDSFAIWAGVFVLIIAALWSLLELLAAWYLRHRYELEVLEPP